MLQQGWPSHTCLPVGMRGCVWVCVIVKSRPGSKWSFNTNFCFCISITHPWMSWIEKYFLSPRRSSTVNGWFLKPALLYWQPVEVHSLKHQNHLKPSSKTLNSLKFLSEQTWRLLTWSCGSVRPLIYTNDVKRLVRGDFGTEDSGRALPVEDWRKINDICCSKQPILKRYKAGCRLVKHLTVALTVILSAASKVKILPFKDPSRTLNVVWATLNSPWVRLGI